MKNYCIEIEGSKYTFVSTKNGKYGKTAYENLQQFVIANYSTLKAVVNWNKYKDNEKVFVPTTDKEKAVVDYMVKYGSHPMTILMSGSVGKGQEVFDEANRILGEVFQGSSAELEKIGEISKPVTIEGYNTNMNVDIKAAPLGKSNSEDAIAATFNLKKDTQAEVIELFSKMTASDVTIYFDFGSNKEISGSLRNPANVKTYNRPILVYRSKQQQDKVITSKTEEGVDFFSNALELYKLLKKYNLGTKSSIMIAGDPNLDSDETTGLINDIVNGALNYDSKATDFKSTIWKNMLDQSFKLFKKGGATVKEYDGYTWKRTNRTYRKVKEVEVKALDKVEDAGKLTSGDYTIINTKKRTITGNGNARQLWTYGKEGGGLKSYSGFITPEPDTIFVFGSNPEGRHGLGAAKTAVNEFGAIYGQGEGLQGNAYALPTKDLRVTANRGRKSISPKQITENIKRMYSVAEQTPNKKFKIGYTNTLDEETLNGYTGAEMIEMFNNAGSPPSNVYFSDVWVNTGKLKGSTVSKENREVVESAYSNRDLKELVASATDEQLKEIRKALEFTTSYNALKKVKDKTPPGSVPTVLINQSGYNYPYTLAAAKMLEFKIVTVKGNSAEAAAINLSSTVNEIEGEQRLTPYLFRINGPAVIEKINKSLGKLKEGGTTRVKLELVTEDGKVNTENKVLFVSKLELKDNFTPASKIAGYEWKKSKDMKFKSKKANISTLAEIAKRLKKLNPDISIDFVTTEDLLELGLDTQASYVRGFVEGKKIYINTDLASGEDLFHELGHIMMEGLKALEPDTYNQAVELALSDPYGETIRDEVAAKYPELSREDLGEEVFVTLLGQVTNRTYLEPSQSTFLNKVYNWIKSKVDSFMSVLNKLFGRGKVDVDEMLDSTLEDLLVNFADKLLTEKVTDSVFEDSKRKFSKEKVASIAQNVSRIEQIGRFIELDESGDFYTKENFDGSKTVLERATKLFQNPEIAKMFNNEDLLFNIEEWKEKTLNNWKAKNSTIPNYDRALELKEKEIEEKIKVMEVLPKIGSELHFALELVFDNEYETFTEFKKDYKTTLIPDNYKFDIYKSVVDLKENILSRYGDDAVVLTEKRLHTTNLNPGIKNVLPDLKGVSGTTDLMILTNEGVDIIDYKFSGKNVEEWSRRKIETINYQQATYKAILESNGVKVNSMKVISGTIDLDGDKFKGVSIDSILGVNTSGKYDADIHQIIRPSATKLATQAGNNLKIFEVLNKFFNVNAPTTEEVKVTEEEVIKRFEYNLSRNYVDNERPSKALGRKIKITKENIKEEIRIEKENLQKLPKVLKDFYADYKHEMTATLTGDTVYNSFMAGVTPKVNDKFKNLFRKYLDQHESVKSESGKVWVQYDWEMVATTQLTQLGLVLMVNKSSGLVDILAITDQLIDTKLDLNLSNKSLLGNYLAKYDELMEDALLPTHGNVAAIKGILFALSNKSVIKSLGGINEIVMISTREESTYRYMPAITLMDNVRKMLYNPKIKDEFELAGEIGDYSELTVQNDIIADYKNALMKTIEANVHRGAYSRTNSAEAAKLKDDLSKEEFVQFLRDRITFISKLAPMGERGGVNYAALSPKLKVEMELLSNALISIQEYRAYNDADLASLGKLFAFGENAMFSNVDDITKGSIKAAYKLNLLANSNIQERMKEFIKSDGGRQNFKTLHEEYFDTSYGKKDDQGYLEAIPPKVLGLMDRKIIGRKLPAYYNLFEYRETENGQWVKTHNFRNPESTSYKRPPFQEELSATEVQFIENFITDINKERTKYNDDFNTTRRYEIPLLRATASSKLRQKAAKGDVKGGLEGYLKELFNEITNPEDAFDQDTDFLTNADYRYQISDTFAISEGLEKRDEMISEAQEGDFEDDLELVYYSYLISKIKREEYNKILPDINAIKALLTIKDTGIFKQFPEIVDYIDKIILKSNIYGKKALSKEDERIMKVTMPLRKIVSTFVVGASYRTSLINLFTNTWNTVSAANGIYADMLGKKDLKDAFMFVMRDIPNNIDNINFLNYISEYFGVHEMEVSKLIRTAREDNEGIIHFERWLHFMNSAPDFFFRMVLFTTEMIKDGVMEIKNGKVTDNSAITFDPKKGGIVYNPELDKRFKAYFRGGGEGYESSKLMYENQVRALKEEYGGVIDDNITRPYVYKEKYAKLKRADSLFQEMSPENQTQFERTAIGNLAMMFQRWLLAKKNIWWKDFDNDEYMGKYEVIKYTDKDGTVQKLIEWKGRPMEGILNSYIFLIKEIYEEKGDVVAAWKTLKDFQKMNVMHGLSDHLTYLIIMFLTQIMYEKDPILKKEKEEQFVGIFALSAKDLFILNTIDGTASKGGLFAVQYSASILKNMLTGVIDPEKGFTKLTNQIGLVRSVREITEA